MPEDPGIKYPAEPKSADKPPNNVPYVIALVIMVVIGIGSVLVVTVLRPEQDNTALITMILGFIVTITGFVMQFMKTEQTHQAVNSRMGELLKLTKKEGVEEGQQGKDNKEQP